MDRKQRAGLGSMLMGVVMCSNVFIYPALGTVLTMSIVVGGLALAFLGFRQFRDPERFTTDEPPSTRRKVAVFGLAAVSFVGGWVYALA